MRVAGRTRHRSHGWPLSSPQLSVRPPNLPPFPTSFCGAIKESFRFQKQFAQAGREVRDDVPLVFSFLPVLI
jgi:hypothetical protein